MTPTRRADGQRLSRRELIAAAGVAGAAAAGLAACGTSRRAAPRVAASPFMRKGLSLEFHLADLANPNDPQRADNRALIADSGTRWIKLFVLQHDLEGDGPPPASAAESWDRLNAADGQLQRLDDVVRGVNDTSTALGARGSIGVILTVLARTPAPDEVDMTSPWAWLVAHLCARYAPGPALPAGGLGPSLAPGEARTGNTTGATITALEIANEPNLGRAPGDTDIAYATAAMMRTAEACAAYWGAPSMLLGPATADNPTGVSATHDAFTQAVLAELGGFTPRMYFGWSHHNYADCFDATPPRTPADPGQTRVAAVQRLLAAGWKDGADRSVWLTEGGVVTLPGTDSLGTATPGQGAAGVAACFGQMQALGRVPLFTTHEIVDPGDPRPGSFCSGLKTSTLRPKPLLRTWSSLPAAPTATG